MVPTSEQTTEVVVQTHGDVNRWEREYARDKIDRLRSMVGAPVLFARARPKAGSRREASSRDVRTPFRARLSRACLGTPWPVSGSGLRMIWRG